MNKDLTLQFLREVSKHISTRYSKSRGDFEVLIFNQGKYTNIAIQPNIRVFRDMRHRKPDDVQDLTYHICKSHVESLYNIDNGQLKIPTGLLHPGIYIYTTLYRCKNRCWVIVNGQSFIKLK